MPRFRPPAERPVAAELENVHASQNASVEKVSAEGRARLVLAGRVDRESAPDLLRRLLVLMPRDGQPVDLDLAAVESMDSAGLAALAEVLARAGGDAAQMRLVGASDAARRTMALFRFQDATEDPPRDAGGPFEDLGGSLLDSIASVRRLLLLLADTFYWAIVGPFKPGRGAPRGELTRQAILLGSRAFGIVALLAALIGITLVMLSLAQLERFGANIYVADMVALAMVREMGPMMTAIIVAGRSGSAIAAELATMEVTEEVDALRAMGFSPVRSLVVPKLYTVTFTQPLLTAVSICAGIGGGLLIATIGLGVPTGAFMNRVGEVLELEDVLVGLLKSLTFGWIILVVAAFCGLDTRGGASAVGLSTTRSVVLAIFAVIVADCIFSLVFYL